VATISSHGRLFPAARNMTIESGPPDTARTTGRAPAKALETLDSTREVTVELRAIVPLN
jgi:hypothetical protein